MPQPSAMAGTSRVFFQGFAGATGLVRIDPGQEIGGQEIREVQQQVSDISLGIDHQGRDTLQGSFFQQVDAQTGFA